MASVGSSTANPDSLENFRMESFIGLMGQWGRSTLTGLPAKTFRSLPVDMIIGFHFEFFI